MIRTRKILERLDHLDAHITRLAQEVHRMAITQEQFDADLAALISSVDNLITAVDTALSSKPPADLTAEDQAVIDASKKVSDEIAALQPEPPPTT